MPNCTISPSRTAYNLDTMFGWLRRIRLRNVPDELPTSLMCHCPLTTENSQCLRLTTLDLNPIGASDGSVGFSSGTPSRSEYRPTRMTESSDGSVRLIGGNGKDGRAL